MTDQQEHQQQHQQLNDNDDNTTNLTEQQTLDQTKHLLVSSGEYRRLLHNTRTELNSSGYSDKLIQHLQTYVQQNKLTFDTVKYNDLYNQAQQYKNNNNVDNNVKNKLFKQISNAIQK